MRSLHMRPRAPMAARPEVLRLASALMMAASASSIAVAQTAAPASAAPAPATPPATAPSQPNTVQGVVVTAPGQELRTSIDRRSYSIAKDLQATTGSIADALRNIPSVDVDVQGNISLRGDPNVTIMIDGKPSGMFRGEGRTAALQQLPADQIERVEVMTNPSAALRPDGSAGVINLISKTSRKPGWSGSVRANHGSEGRTSGGVSGAYNSRKLTVAGDFGFRTDPQKYRSLDDRIQIDEETGGVLIGKDRTTGIGDGSMWNARTSVDYDLTDRTRLSAQVRHSDVDVSAGTFEHFEQRLMDALSRVYDRNGTIDFDVRNTEVSGSWRQRFKDPDHELVVNLSHENSYADFRNGLLYAERVPPRADVYERLAFVTETDETELKVDYTRPMSGGSKLKLGYNLNVELNDYDNFGARGPRSDAVVVDPSMTNLFAYDQTVHAGYVTYERPIGDLTVLAGLRAEQTLIDINQITSNVQVENDYFRLYPSLHLSHKLPGDQQVTASYSRRIQRPSARDLNPYRVYVDPLNYREGNPFLEPQVTDSFEVAYQRRKGSTYYLATLYYRESSKGVTDVVRELGDGILLSTRENLGQGRNGGLELVANGKITKTLSYNVSGNAYWFEIDASRLGFSGTRSDVTLAGRGSLSWQVTPKDFLQAQGNLMGQRLTAQGYIKNVGLLNLGYRRKLNDSLSFVVTAPDVLGTLRLRQVFETPGLERRTLRENNMRAIHVGLTYTFGSAGRKPRDPGFDFGGGTTPQ
ncbi:TonB-dependent receptor [Caulobacter segnis]|uniref:TonB-dependent receptor domain-containing protein n=1 Tax=Caulobacter segnis TaxID=88688 RepID=UPI00240EA1F3|nr:TonB-dependent receptor [Caulobacter segnis]MDG2522429.1 TonB-dependent receptor [Caulobacter segnis]